MQHPGLLRIGIGLSVVLLANGPEAGARVFPSQEGGQPSSSQVCTSNPPGYQVTWETDAAVLVNKLLVTPLPAGVTITGSGVHTGGSATPNPRQSRRTVPSAGTVISA